MGEANLVAFLIQCSYTWEPHGLFRVPHDSASQEPVTGGPREMDSPSFNLFLQGGDEIHPAGDEIPLRDQRLASCSKFQHPTSLIEFSV